jgi:hypothetical protein
MTMARPISGLFCPWLAAISASVLLCGCSPILTIEFYNNSGEAVTITGCGKIDPVAPGAIVELKPYDCADLISCFLSFPA